MIRNDALLAQTPIPSFIADQFCNQLISMQRSIESRGPDLCFPTPQELNMQTKIVTNVIRIKKYNAADAIDKAFKQFIKFAARADKQLGKAIADTYNQFMGIDTEEAAATEDYSTTQQPIEETPQPPQVPAKPVPQPPVTLADFHKHADQLKHYQYGTSTDKVLFNNKEVNRYWLEHNLTQYTLPEHEREFIWDEHQIFTYRQRHNIQLKIEAYLARA